MNAAVHAQLSCKAAKTESQKDFEFFYRLHDFTDSSKEVEASNLHRWLTHHHLFLKRVIIPIFGHTYVCENGTKVNIKDDIEKNHFLCDFRNRFIATLSDYVSLISPDPTDEERFKSFRAQNPELFSTPELEELMLSPLANTGMIESLMLTHNSWFCGEILPKLYPNIKIKLKDSKEFSPSVCFNRMKFADWVDNGRALPPSAKKIVEHRESKKTTVEFAEFFKTPPPDFDDKPFHKFPRTSPGLID